MKKFFIFFLLLNTLFGAEKDFYRNYNTLAKPLFSPWLIDKLFNSIDSHFFDSPIEVKYQRYLQFVLAKNSLENCGRGDLIECGVCNGKSLDIIASVVDLYDKKRIVYGIDSFEGLSKPGVNDNEVGKGRSFFQEGAVFGGTLEEIKTRLSKHECQIKLMKGWIPIPFAELKNCQFCFAHIDVDLYQPTKDSLEFIYPKMLAGGIILFDDYGFPMCPGARKAIDDFLKNKKESLISIPSGQAFIIKSKNSGKSEL